MCTSDNTKVKPEMVKVDDSFKQNLINYQR